MFENKIVKVEDATNHAISMHIDFKGAKKNSSTMSLEKKVSSKPKQGCLKLIVDVALFPKHLKEGVWCVLIDEHDSVFMAVSESEASVTDPLEVELLALVKDL